MTGSARPESAGALAVPRLHFSALRGWRERVGEPIRALRWTLLVYLKPCAADGRRDPRREAPALLPRLGARSLAPGGLVNSSITSPAHPIPPLMPSVTRRR